ncbi:MAG: hypothetical protein R3A44_06190 [Caldilineaceae bacterium]
MKKKLVRHRTIILASLCIITFLGFIIWSDVTFTQETKQEMVNSAIPSTSHLTTNNISGEENVEVGGEELLSLDEWPEYYDTAIGIKFRYPNMHLTPSARVLYPDDNSSPNIVAGYSIPLNSSRYGSDTLITSEDIYIQVEKYAGEDIHKIVGLNSQAVMSEMAYLVEINFLVKEEQFQKALNTPTGLFSILQIEDVVIDSKPGVYVLEDNFVYGQSIHKYYIPIRNRLFIFSYTFDQIDPQPKEILEKLISTLKIDE